MPKKLAFCFLIRDSIHHEEIWNLFFKNVETQIYNIYIHYKTNTPLTFFENYKLSNCIETSWGNISLVKAQNLLLEEGVKDEENTHFIFLSESCIPLKPFSYIYNHLDNAFSYFNIAPQRACFPRCISVTKYVAKETIQKAAQWCILNRKHALLMILEKEYLCWFEHVFAADEHCYITNIYSHALQNELITTPNIADGATTFINWPDMKYKYPSSGGLKNYDHVSEEELSHLTKSNSFFGRKFTKECCLLGNSLYGKSILSQ